jgi:hypothetical protein
MGKTKPKNLSVVFNKSPPNGKTPDSPKTETPNGKAVETPKTETINEKTDPPKISKPENLKLPTPYPIKKSHSACDILIVGSFE